MAKRKGYMILSSMVQNEVFEDDAKKKEFEDEKESFLASIKKLASDPTPDNRYKLAQLVGYTINDMIMQRLNWIPLVADTKNGALGDKPEFTLNYSGITSKIGAKGHTPDVSMIMDRQVVVPTVEVSARPKCNFRDLIRKPEKIVDMVNDAMRAMENDITEYIEGVLYATQSLLATPNYVSGAGLSKTTFDPIVTAIKRLNGEAVILGDIDMVEQLTAFTGFSNRVAEEYMVEHNTNGFIGQYKSAQVLQLTNRYSDESSIADTNLVLRNDLLYVLPVGSADNRPLKVFMEGAVRAMDRTKPEDESFEIFIRMDFGAQVVANQNKLGMAEDTSI